MNLRRGFVFLSLLFFSACASSPSVTETSDLPESPSLPVAVKSLSDSLNEMIPNYLSANQAVGIAIGIIQNGKAQSFYFGETTKGSGQKPNGSTLFMIGSISKNFTADLLALFVEKQLVHYGDELQTYVPAGVTVPLFAGSTNLITLESLATHTSGLPRNSPVPPAIPGSLSVDELFNSLNQTALLSAPGTSFLYSNLGFEFLGQVLAKVGAKKWEDLVAEEISAPLTMVDTKVETQLDNDEISRRAQGYGSDGLPASFLMPTSPAAYPAGGLYSTIDDMLKYLFYNMGQSQSPLNTLLDDLFTPRYPVGAGGSIGLAWMTTPLSGSGDQVTWKLGSVSGFTSYIGFAPEKGTGVVILINFRSDQLSSLGENLLNYLIAHPQK